MLVLDRQTLAYIFMGNISVWSDGRILSLQSAAVAAKLARTDQPISIIVREDGSGSTEVFTKSLNL
jgi:ABC-type phosphate transport system substrate-binding protein